MKRKRLDRDIGWGFQGFPYYQFRLETKDFHGLVAYIEILSGDYSYWYTEKAGRVATCGEGMKWVQLIPDGKSRMLTAMINEDGRLSVCYIDIIERIERDPDGVLAYVDKYLDIVFTPQGDFSVHDRDELDAALTSKDLTEAQYEAALKEADEITAEILPDIKGETAKLERIYRRIKKMAESGEIKPLDTKYQKMKRKGD